MNTLPKLKLCCERGHAMKQRGVVLFFTLIALVVMSLAAVALIRSVDTSTMIAGNMAFKQAGTSSGDAGIEAAIAWLKTANTTMVTAGLDVYKNVNHVFNKDGGAGGFTDANGVACCLNTGYHSNVAPDCSNPALPCAEPILANRLNLTAADATNGTRVNWDNTDSALVGTDSSGNTIRYVIQRMVRTANTMPNLTGVEGPTQTGGLFNNAAISTSGQQVLAAPESCPTCPTTAGMTALLRITAKVTGPKNTVSYIQTIVY
jgi:Tfp pilus assembly protein PilX